MPVIGSVSSSSSGGGVRGVSIPPGSLDVWRAARAAHASTLAEVCILGDSTWWGQSATGSNLYSTGNRSPIAKIRELSIAAGFTDGGAGIVGPQDSAQSLGLPVDPVDRGFTAAGGSTGYNIISSCAATLNATQTVTYRPRTTRARVFHAATGDSGSYTTSVNGAATVTRTPGSGGGLVPYLITGMTAGVDNTIVFANVSGVNRIDVEFINDVGIVYHKTCIPGAQISTFSYDELTAGTFQKSPALQAAMGLQSPGTAFFASGAPEGTHPLSRTVRLAGITMGINDINGVAQQLEITAADNITPANTRAIRRECAVFGAGVDLAIQAARNGGADVFVAIPHWKVNQAGNVYSRIGWLMGQTLQGVARANNTVVVDLNEALGGPVGRWSNTYYDPTGVHLKVPAYDAIGAFVFNNVINA